MLPVEYEVRSMRKIGLPCFTHNAAATSLDAAAAFSLYSGERRNRRVRSCNHTSVADSFEKRDDFCIARKFSDEFFLLIRLCQNPVHTSRTSARTGLGVTKMKCLTVRPEPSRRAPIEFHTVCY